MDIYTKINLSVSAEQAWETIGEKFGDFGEWISVLNSSQLEGTLGVNAKRVCRTKKVGPFPPSVISEKLVAFNPKNHSYTYVVDNGLPSILKSAQNQWKIVRIDDKNCTVFSHATLTLKFWLFPFSWLLKIAMKKDIKKSFEEMKHFIETGKTHPRKTSSLQTAKV